MVFLACWVTFDACVYAVLSTLLVSPWFYQRRSVPISMPSRCFWIGPCIHQHRISTLPIKWPCRWPAWWLPWSPVKAACTRKTSGLDMYEASNTSFYDLYFGLVHGQAGIVLRRQRKSRRWVESEVFIFYHLSYRRRGGVLLMYTYFFALIYKRNPAL